MIKRQRANVCEKNKAAAYYRTQIFTSSVVTLPKNIFKYICISIFLQVNALQMAKDIYADVRL